MFVLPYPDAVGNATRSSVEFTYVTLLEITFEPETNTFAEELNPVPTILIYELVVATAVSSKLLKLLSVIIIDVITTEPAPMPPPPDLLLVNVKLETRFWLAVFNDIN